MAQYRIYTDGANKFRVGVRDGGFVMDKALTETGFNGTENVDWEQLAKYEREA